MDFEVLKTIVEAKSRRLTSAWTLTGIDVEDALLQAMSNQISTEIDSQILTILRDRPARFSVKEIDGFRRSW